MTVCKDCKAGIVWAFYNDRFQAFDVGFPVHVITKRVGQPAEATPVFSAYILHSQVCPGTTRKYTPGDRRESERKDLA